MKRVIAFGLGLSLMALLVAAAVVGGQWLGHTAAVSTSAPSGKGQWVMTPAADVPRQPADADGRVVWLSDNSIFLCPSSSGPSVNADGTVNKSGACAQALEVVIAHDTRLLRDVTTETYASRPATQTCCAFSQYVSEGALRDIAPEQRMCAQVWGERRGERLTARLVVYWSNCYPAGTN